MLVLCKFTNFAQNKTILKNKIIIISSIAAYIIILSVVLFYIFNANFYGTIKIISENEIYVKAKSPFNKNLNFKHVLIDNKHYYYYNHPRFYKEFRITARNTDSYSKTEIYKNNKNLVYDDFIYGEKIKIKTDNYFQRLLNLCDFIFFRKNFWIYVLITSSIFVLYYVIMERYKIFNQISIFFNVLKNSFFYQILFSLLITSITSYIYFSNPANIPDNNIYLSFGPDQFDYHTIAVNHAKGAEFGINGPVFSNTDYKIITENRDFNITNFYGLKALNRFPGYQYIMSIIYRIFKPEPIVAKTFNIIIVLILCVILPLILKKSINISGYFAGLFAIPFVFHQLIFYAHLILPDILTVFINLLIIYFWIYLKKDFKNKYFYLLAILLGISFLVKTSIAILIPIIIIDLYQILKKRGFLFLYILKSLAFFLLLFLIFWLPYNIYSVKEFYKLAEISKSIIVDVSGLSETEFISKYNQKNIFQTKYFVLNNLAHSEILKFKNDVMPEIERTGYFPLYLFNNEKPSSNIVKLSYLKIISLNKKPYFMISLIANYGALECHNEYLKDGKITNEWIFHKNSFYNNDNFANKSQFIRIANFYINNPTEIFRIAHSKLIDFVSHSKMFILFTLIAIFYFLIKTLETKKQKVLLIIIIIAIVAINLLPQCIPYAFIFLLIIMLFSKEEKIIPVKPVLFLALNGIAFTLIAYSSPRYSIYYLFMIYPLILYILIMIIQNFMKKLSINFLSKD